MSRTVRLAVLAVGAALIAPVAISMAHAQSSMMAPEYRFSRRHGNVSKQNHCRQRGEFAGIITTLVAAVKAAGLAGALSGTGPFTVFAPTNEAFADLPAGTVDSLVKPENKATLTKILTYHVVPGDYNTTKIRSMILAGGGKTELKSLEGGTLTFMMNGSSNIVVEDEKGDMADITIADVAQSNGVIQVIDKVLMPG